MQNRYKPKIAYLLKTWPKISETFVLQEILALQRNDICLHIASLQQPTDQQAHTETGQVEAQVDYLDAGTCTGWLIVTATLACLLQHPLRLIKTILFLLNTKQQDRSSTAIFYQAVCMARLVSQYKIQHIHAHFASEPTAVAELVNHLTGSSYSISAHAKDIYLSPEPVLQRKIANARFVVTCTEYNCRYLKQLNQSTTPVLRVYHGFDPRRFEQCVIEPESSHSDQQLILSVGRLREKKGFETLIHACRQLKLAGYQFRCDIVGYGPQQDNLQALIRSLNLEQVVNLRGQLIHTELIALYSQANIFALPCQIGDDGDRDGIPNVLMEAMAMKLPVVSSRISGIPELVEDQISGLLIEPNNPQQLSEALCRLLNDQQLRHSLGHAARQRVLDEFAVEPNIEILKKLFIQSVHSTEKPVVSEPSVNKGEFYAS